MIARCDGQDAEGGGFWLREGMAIGEGGSCRQDNLFCYSRRCPRPSLSLALALSLSVRVFALAGIEFVLVHVFVLCIARQVAVFSSSLRVTLGRPCCALAASTRGSK